MEHSWHTRRVEGVNTPFYLQFGITEQSLLREEHGVGFGDPVPHAALRAATIVQPRTLCLHAFHHSPDPACATVADDLNNISRLVLCAWSCNNDEAFSLSIAHQAVQQHSLCLPEYGSSDSLFQPSHTNRPPSIHDGAPNPHLSQRHQMNLGASFCLFGSLWRAWSQFPPIRSGQQVLAVHCPEPDSTPAEHHEHTGKQGTSEHQAN